MFHFQENSLECDFKGGAGAASQEIQYLRTQVKETCEHSSEEIAVSNGSSDGDDMNVADKVKITKQETPVRQSARTAGKSFKYEF